MEPVLEYQEPAWSALPGGQFRLEILKNGVMLAENHLPTNKKYLSCGRLPICDLPMEHSSISRFHAVIQFSHEKAFIFDLGSTHGTFLNKAKLKPRTYVEIPEEGAVVRFGESTRQYIISYPAVAAASTVSTAGYQKDPEGFLRKWLHSRSQDFDAEVERIEGAGFVASICIDAGLLGAAQDLTVSATGPSKKAALSDTALQVCEELARRDLLGSPSSAKRPLESDGEASFEDDFFDRTKKNKPATEPKLLTLESLEAKRASLEEQIRSIQTMLQSRPQLEAGEGDGDELAKFMEAMAETAHIQDQTKYSGKLAALQQNLQETVDLIRFVAPPSLATVGLPVTADPLKEEGASLCDEDWVPPSREESEASAMLKEKLGY